MIKLVVNNSRIKVMDLEEDKMGEKNYTINLVRKLKENYAHSFSLISGSDILHNICRWFSYKELCEEIDFIIYERSDFEIIQNSGVDVRAVLNFKIDNISSSEIREKVKRREDVISLVGQEVSDYIVWEELYAN